MRLEGRRLGAQVPGVGARVGVGLHRREGPIRQRLPVGGKESLAALVGGSLPVGSGFGLVVFRWCLMGILLPGFRRMGRWAGGVVLMMPGALRVLWLCGRWVRVARATVGGCGRVWGGVR
jgi:hypothetical protein